MSTTKNTTNIPTTSHHCIIYCGDDHTIVYIDNTHTFEEPLITKLFSQYINEDDNNKTENEILYLKS